MCVVLCVWSYVVWFYVYVILCVGFYVLIGSILVGCMCLVLRMLVLCALVLGVVCSICWLCVFGSMLLDVCSWFYTMGSMCCCPMVRRFYGDDSMFCLVICIWFCVLLVLCCWFYVCG